MELALNSNLVVHTRQLLAVLVLAPIYLQQVSFEHGENLIEIQYGGPPEHFIYAGKCDSKP